MLDLIERVCHQLHLHIYAWVHGWHIDMNIGQTRYHMTVHGWMASLLISRWGQHAGNAWWSMAVDPEAWIVCSLLSDSHVELNRKQSSVQHQRHALISRRTSNTIFHFLPPGSACIFWLFERTHATCTIDVTIRPAWCGHVRTYARLPVCYTTSISSWLVLQNGFPRVACVHARV